MFFVKSKHLQYNSFIFRRLFEPYFQRTVKQDFRESKISNQNNMNETIPDVRESSVKSIQYLPTPTKSQNDKKEYRVISLTNKLTALLISDLQEENEEDDEFEDEMSAEEESSISASTPTSNKGNSDDSEDESHSHETVQEEKLSALGLCVGVGSFSDPWDIQGMAHFLEHMVFMGSEKFPKENDFDAFIKKRGGSDNAQTDCETTTFYFECQDKDLKEAIDKFSQFFVSPLMRREGMTREREAIESEFQMSVTSDETRREQLLCSLANPENPTRKFTWGNLITLRDNVTDDNLYKAVHEFRNKHYSAHRMTLAVQSRLPLETLEPWIQEFFSAVPVNEIPPDDFKKYSTSVFNASEFNKIYWVKSVKDLCEVELTWALPPLRHMYHTKPEAYVQELIGHEGKGSLLSYLRKKVWALGLSSGCNDDGLSNNSMFTLFCISIVLTRDGLKHLQEVLNAVFGYIKMLQMTRPSESFFSELQTIQETKFRFAEEVPPDENVETLATNMQFYPPEDYITGPELIFRYDPEAIQRILDALKPDTVNIMVSCQDHGKELDRKEPWFQTEYSVSDIPNDWLELWQKIEPNPSFRMPDPNIFLTTNFDLLPFSEEDDELTMPYPVKVLQNEAYEIWYRRDFKFKLPQAFIYVYLVSPFAVTTPENAALTDLYVGILNQMLVEELYPAHAADLECLITAADKGIVLKFKGYNEKLHLLLEAVVKYMANFENNLTPELFSAMKDLQIRNYYNNFLKPEKLNKDLRLSLVLHTYSNAVDKHTSLSKVDLTTLINFAKEFVKSFYIQGLFQGNLTDEQAIEACNKVKEILMFEPLSPVKFPEIRVLEVPLGEQCCRVNSFNTEDTNSTVTNYYQSGLFNLKNYCIVELIVMLMEEPVFDILRTKEQLGYHVYSTLRYTFGVLGFSVTVNCQAVKHSTEHVDNRIEVFLKKFSKTMKKMKDKELSIVRSSLIRLKKLSDIHLKEEVNRNWEEIASREYMFDRLKKEVAYLENIKLSEIRKWYHNHVLCGNKKNFRKLSVQVVGSAVSKTKEQKKDEATTSHRGRRHSKERPSVLQSGFTGKPVSNPSVEFSLQFIVQKEKQTKNSKKFITDINNYKRDLPMYPPVELNRRKTIRD